jgi:hypothetical protein
MRISGAKAATLIAFFALSTVVSGQTSLESKLDQPVALKEFSLGKAYDAIFDIASKYDIPVGVEADFVQTDVTDGTIKTCAIPASPKLRTFFDSLTTCFPKYQWNERGGVINIAVKDKHIPHPLLDTMISEFNVRFDDLDTLKGAIIRNPDVQANLALAGFEVRELSFGNQEHTSDVRGGTISLKNITVREILNETLRTTNYRYWSIVTWGPDRKYLWIIFRK